MYFNRLSDAITVLNNRLADEAIDDYINEIIKCMYNEDNLVSRKKIYNDYILNSDPKFYKYKDKKL